jgi:hypothetical protein
LRVACEAAEVCSRRQVTDLTTQALGQCRKATNWLQQYLKAASSRTPARLMMDSAGIAPDRGIYIAVA